MQETDSNSIYQIHARHTVKQCQFVHFFFVWIFFSQLLNYFVTDCMGCVMKRLWSKSNDAMIREKDQENWCHLLHANSLHHRVECTETYIGQTKQLKINWTELIGNFIVFVLLLFVQILRTRLSWHKKYRIFFLFRKYEPFYGSDLKCIFYVLGLETWTSRIEWSCLIFRLQWEYIC